MPRAAVTIRKGRLGDESLLAKLGAETFYDSFAAQNTPENMAAYLAASFSPARQAQELAEPGSVFFIAEVDGQPAGYARLLESPPPGSVGGQRPVELVRIYARQAFIGHGVGSTLMAACLDYAGQAGHDIIWLGVWSQNPRALQFYERWGFTRVGEHIFQLGDDPQTDYIYQRSLSGGPRGEPTAR